MDSYLHLLLQDCNLYQLMKDRDKYFPESQIRNWVYQILQVRLARRAMRGRPGGGGLLGGRCKACLTGEARLAGEACRAG